MTRYALLLAMLLTQAATVPAFSAETSAKKTVITQAELLPKRTVTLSQLPSEYLDGPRENLRALVIAYEANLRNDLEVYDIKDTAALLNHYSQLSSLAQFRGDWAEVKRLSSHMRPLTRRAGSAATVGVLPGILGEQVTGKHDAAWVRKEVEKRFGAMSWADAGDIIKNMKAQIERFDPAEVRQTFQQRLNALAREQQMVVPEGMVSAIASSRVQIELVGPLKFPIVSGLQAVIDRNTPKAAVSAASK